MSYVSVQIDLSDFETEHLITEVERRGYEVHDANSKEESECTLDEIHNLYQAFINWKDFGNKNESFECDLKEFFKVTLGRYVI